MKPFCSKCFQICHESDLKGAFVAGKKTPGSGCSLVQEVLFECRHCDSVENGSNNKKRKKNEKDWTVSLLTERHLNV